MTKRIKRLWKLSHELYARHRARFALLTVLGFAGGFLEAVGITLLIPLFTLFVTGGDAGDNFALRVLSDVLEFFHLSLSFQTLLIVTLTAFFFKTAFLFGVGFARARAIAVYRTDMRVRLYEGFLSASFPYLRKQKTGHMAQILGYNIKQTTRLLDDFIGFILAAGNSLVFLAVSFALSWPITLLTIALGGLLVFFLWPLVRRMYRYARDLLVLGKRIPHMLAETLQGIKTIKALGAEGPVAAAARELFLRTERAEFRKYCVKLFTKLSFEPVSIVFILAVFAVSYRYLSFDLVSFIAIIYLITRVFGNVNNMQSGLSTMMEFLPAADDLSRALREVRAAREGAGGDKPFAFAHSLALERVSFSYGARAALDHITLRISRGEMVGIIGPSGAGKTTLVDVLLGLFAPTEGRVILDGVDAREIRRDEWRRNIIYVPQEPFVRNASLAENVRFYDPTISDAEVEGALRRAHLAGALSSFSDGIAENLGERGSRLSGGERQRVALARALARKPAVLILDEATSALDGESEQAIKAMLSELRGAVTVIIIAHRLSTVADADRIVAIENGRIVEEGAPAALARNPDSYYSRSLRAAAS